MPFKGESALIAKPMVGYSYVPIQQADMRNISSVETGLVNGTVFPILNKPLGVYGKQFKGDVIFDENASDTTSENPTSKNGGAI